MKNLKKGEIIEITLEDCQQLGSGKLRTPKWVRFCDRWLRYREDWKVKVKITKTESVYVTLTKIKNDKLFRARLRFSHHPLKYGQVDMDYFLNVEDLKVSQIINQVNRAYKKWKRESSDSLDVVKTY
jgi:predicted RNA-binding protein with TRAM domain